MPMSIGKKNLVILFVIFVLIGVFSKLNYLISALANTTNKTNLHWINPVFKLINV